MKKPNRYNRVGKDWNEKEAYKNFLSSKFYLDKTEEDSVDISKTDESSFNEEEMKTPNVQKKSSRLKVKDFFLENFAISIFSGILIIIFGGYVYINREQGIQGSQISSLKEDVKDIKDDINNNEKNQTEIKENFNIFKAQITTELDFLKKQLNAKE